MCNDQIFLNAVLEIISLSIFEKSRTNALKHMVIAYLLCVKTMLIIMSNTWLYNFTHILSFFKLIREASGYKTLL